MSKLTTSKDSPAVVALTVDRVYRLTPPVDCTVGIGPEPAGRVAHDHRYAQLHAGVTYEFATNATDQYLTALSQRDPGDLDYLNNRAKPPPAGA